MNKTFNHRPRIYTDGIYDLFHYAHALQLKQAKESLPDAVLIVGVCGDALTRKYKGKTVLTERERYESVRHCKYVDEVIEDAPWVLTPAFLEQHRIDYVAQDPTPYPHPETGADLYAWLKDAGRFIATRRTDGISTSAIITRILRDYDDYALRNLARGCSEESLGIGFLRGQKLRLFGKMKALEATARRSLARLTTARSR